MGDSPSQWDGEKFYGHHLTPGLQAFSIFFGFLCECASYSAGIFLYPHAEFNSRVAYATRLLPIQTQHFPPTHSGSDGPEQLGREKYCGPSKKGPRGPIIGPTGAALAWVIGLCKNNKAIAIKNTKILFLNIFFGPPLAHFEYT
jgi:hypothetical protein